MAEIDQKADRLKVFLTYYHQDDQYYRDQFEELCGHSFINKSIRPGEIETNNSAEYINQLIQSGYIDNSTVVVVLLGKKTWGRKHVDWEISAGLHKKSDGPCAGLQGIILPDFPITSTSQYKLEDIPPRLADNVQTGFAEIHAWRVVCVDESIIKTIIEKAFERRISQADKVNNARPLFGKNRS